MIQFRTPTDVQVDTTKLQALVSALPTNPMGGWFDLPEAYDRAELAAIQAAAAKIQQTSEYLVCIGIGGSYLGHRALSEALRPTSGVKLLYAGNSLSPTAYADLFATLGDHDFSVNVISKSGTTTEPAVAFRLLKAKLYAKYGDAAKARIYATTDAAHGALHDEAVAEGYQRFVVPDNIGGRYSVLSAVGLLPLAAAGVDIEALLAGAAAERQTLINALQAAAPSASETTSETTPETTSETAPAPQPSPSSLSAAMPACAPNSLRRELTWKFSPPLSRISNSSPNGGSSSSANPRVSSTRAFSLPPSSIPLTSTRSANTSRRAAAISLKPCWSLLPHPLPS